MSTLLDANRFFVRQKAKLIELTNEFKILDEQGVEIAVVRQEGQSVIKKAARLVSRLDTFMTHSYAVYEPDGHKVLELTRPRALLRSQILVADASGREVGKIAQKKLIGKIRFTIESPSGAPLGEIRGLNWRSWNFSIVDASEREIGRISKQWAGVGRELFTNADHYMVEIDPDVTGDLRLVLVAAASGIDTALKQDAG